MKRCLCWLVLLVMLVGFAPAGGEQKPDLPPEYAFYNEVVFVGDSLMNQLHRHRTALRNEGVEIFGNARFLSAGAYSLYLAGFDQALKDQPALLYRGQWLGLGPALKAMEAKEVYMMLGLADDPGRDPERDKRRYTRVIEGIRKAVPDIQITALSLTPITKRGESRSTTQKGIDVFNQNLEGWSHELGIGYLDVATALKNADGYLDSSLSNDKKVHLNEEGLRILTALLHQHASVMLQERGE